MFDVAEKAKAAAVGGERMPFSVIPGARAESTQLVRSTHPALSLHEETLRVATRIRMAVSESEKSIAITGPASADLASEVAQDMALAFSQFAPGQVLLLAANSTHARYHEAGLAEVITGKCTLQSALIEPVDGGPWLLPAGNLTSDRSHLYFSAECALLFGTLSQRFKHIFVDAGPLSTPASLVIVGLCDAVAVAVAAGPHHKKELVAVQKELARIKTKMLGVILTKSVRQEQKR